jgi:arylsulfatase A-like enzyme
MADQLRCDVLGAYGDQQCPTPRLDLLAQRAVVFHRHFTPCPLCKPARSSVMTGLTPRQHGAIINGWRPAEQAYGMIGHDLPLLPKQLCEAGYRVVHVGVQQVQSMPGFTEQLPEVEFYGPASPGQHLKHLEERGLM